MRAQRVVSDVFNRPKKTFASYVTASFVCGIHNLIEGGPKPSGHSPYYGMKIFSKGFSANLRLSSTDKARPQPRPYEKTFSLSAFAAAVTAAFPGSAISRFR
jgi:hypothetical protein